MYIMVRSVSLRTKRRCCYDKNHNEVDFATLFERKKVSYFVTKITFFLLFVS